ncbi:DUF6934 family protein [Dyadobacter sp. MSC1_007]|jgi:hypothetical protein|uniref:DUF6934 family protein n=1 Tax=Dyadobacter sp. MSC1_007 TaxID=2909264 RepID=UPI00203045F8|nr:hypothetical protein [Dyadobacter sp. MSC1_007]
MNTPVYPHHRVGSQHTYLFFSVGTNGEISKVVRFSQMATPEFNIGDTIHYNVAFGDLKETNGDVEVDDSVRSNNGDMRKVLATVARIMEVFMKKHPGAVLFVSGYVDLEHREGHNNQRSTLYQKIIDANWDALSPRFQFWGVIDRQLEIYMPRKSYEHVLIKRR